MKITDTSQLQSKWIPFLQSQLSSHLLCAFCHGESAADSFVGSRSNPWRVALFLDTTNPEELPDFFEIQSQTPNTVFISFIFSHAMVQQAEDVYPLEFLAYAQHHKVLYGEFPFAGFVPQVSHLRAQCERELRGMLIHLRREYFLTPSTAKSRRALMAAVALKAQDIFPGVVWLLTQAWHQEPVQLWQIICEQLQVQDMHQVHLDLVNQNCKDNGMWDTAIKNYIAALEAIVQKVDVL
jgi:hypothetical protein